MGVSYKNFWSLNTDEAVVSGILRNETNKNIEVLMPMNAQMKGVDLVLMNVDTKSAVTIQVKGSKAFEPKKNELRRHGHGNVGWFYLEGKTIFGATAEFFIFLIYVIEEDVQIGRRTLSPHSIVIPTKKLQELTTQHKKIHGKRYSYYFWINPKTKEAFDIRDEEFYVSEYLDKSGFEKLNFILK
ncbi:hypothetical protein L6270_05070 [Candidatus Parcubacteria bacterium]|nr:hypothetical protein [Patescibacteria group bacterium]MBU4309333.1 hypothetical protein [Patescibacteria group bacterium]MBU4432310.1 hypothetical protein [Patescibacteria group bacterium]MBU4577694.1 hypothetical protein [Patescibacteria group bacterium]MCG2697380.1 hypothetical protein [Candidatus Parcubacteria bacterium]